MGQLPGTRLMEFIAPRDKYKSNERRHNEVLAQIVVNWCQEMRKLGALTPPPKDLIDWYVRWEKRLEDHNNASKLVLPTGYTSRS